MEFILSILLCLGLSADSFSMGLNYGIRGICVSVSSRIIISLVSAFNMLLALWAGSFILLFADPVLAKAAGCAMLMLLGIFVIFQGFTKNAISGDLDNNRRITWAEALYVGFALSVDSFGAGICFAVSGSGLLFLPLCSGACQFFLMQLGNFFGKKINSRSKISKKLLVTISGSLICLMAAVRFFG